MTWGIETAARTLWQEARGETTEGQRAVAHVIKNRVKDGRWGDSLASVCLWKGQFSGWYVPRGPNFAGACSLADDDAGLLKMIGVLTAVLSEEADPTNGATHYINLSIAQPVWIRDAVHCGKFGHHDFYKGVP